METRVLAHICAINFDSQNILGSLTPLNSSFLISDLVVLKLVPLLNSVKILVIASFIVIVAFAGLLLLLAE